MSGRKIMKFPHFELSTRLRNDTKSALLQADFISVSQQTDILVFQTRKKQFKEQFDCVKEISETFQCEEIWTYICRSHRRWPRCWRQLELYRLKIVKKIRQNTIGNKFWKVKTLTNAEDDLQGVSILGHQLHEWFESLEKKELC